MILFLDYDGVVNSVMWEFIYDDRKYVSRYADPHDGKVNNYQAVQWVSELCQKYDMDIVVTSTWRKWDNYKICLINGGLRRGINILGKVTDDNTYSRAHQIYQYILQHPDIGDEFLILDDELVDMSEFGYDKDAHFVQCLTNAGFQLEEFEEARRKVEAIIKTS